MFFLGTQAQTAPMEVKGFPGDLVSEDHRDGAGWLSVQGFRDECAGELASPSVRESLGGVSQVEQVARP